MSIETTRNQAFDNWWASLPEIHEFSSHQAIEDQLLLESELIGMADETRLQGKKRTAFSRIIRPNIEMSVDKWGDVIRRLTGYGIGRFADANDTGWLVFARMETCAIFRSETDRRVSHTLKSAALLSKTAMGSILVQEPAAKPQRICMEVEQLFDAIDRETKYDLDGPDAVINFPTYTMQFGIVESGQLRPLHNEGAEEFTSFLNTISPIPTIVPVANGGLIVDKQSIDLPFPVSPRRDLMGTEWVPEAELSPDMKRVLAAWSERLSNKELWVPRYDPDAMQSLTLELLP